MFEFKPAKRENVKLLIGLAGASGAGKTKTALELATGLSPSGKIGFLDTEARRGLHYASEYKFHHADMRPPFEPARFTEGIRAAEDAGMEVCIIDSASHEYDGEGGIMDWADDIEAGEPKPGIDHPRTSGSNDKDWRKDWLRKPVPGAAKWKEPKAAHKNMMNALLQARCHIIFCLRADEKIRIVAPSKDNGWKTQIEQLGWVPICEKRFMYEMTLSLTLRPDNPGKPNFDLPHKIQDQHRHMFPEGEFITRMTGAALAVWSSGEDQPQPSKQSKREKSPVDEYALEVADNVKTMTPEQITLWWADSSQRRLDLEIPAERLAKMESAVQKAIG